MICLDDYKKGKKNLFDISMLNVYITSLFEYICSELISCDIKMITM